MPASTLANPPLPLCLLQSCLPSSRRCLAIPTSGSTTRPANTPRNVLRLAPRHSVNYLHSLFTLSPEVTNCTTHVHHLSHTPISPTTSTFCFDHIDLTSTAPTFLFDHTHFPLRLDRPSTSTTPTWILDPSTSPTFFLDPHPPSSPTFLFDPSTSPTWP